MSSITEKRALGILKEKLLSTYSIDPHIPEDDKEAIWDGYISVYTKSSKLNRNFKKVDFLGKINVQVKGRTVEKFNKNISVKRIDLEKFALEPATIYYVIQMNEKKSNIYYYEFYNVEVKRILLNLENDTITLPFEKLPLKPNDIYKLHELFLKNQSLQVVQNNSILSLSDVFKKNPNPTLTFDLLLPANFTNEDISNSVLTQKPFICYHEGDIKIPVERLVDKVSVVSYINRVRVFNFENDDALHKMQIIFENNLFKHIIIDNNVKMFNEEDGTTATIKYNRTKNLDETLNILTIVESIIMSKRIKFHDAADYIDGFNPNQSIYYKDSLDVIQTEKNIFNKLKIVLETLNINKSIDISLLKDIDIKNINTLYDALVLEKEVPFGVKDNYVGILELANITILLNSIDKGNGKYRLYNYFTSKEYELYYGNEKKKVSKYIVLVDEYPKFNGFKLCNNIDINQLLSEVLNDYDDDIYLSYLNSMMLALIEFYDINNEMIYLDAAYKISCYLLEKTYCTNYLINKYQIEYRKKITSSSYKEDLLCIKNSSDYDIYRCGAAILLDSVDDFEYYFNKLAEIEQENFKKYPIYYLYSKNKAVKGDN